MAHPEQKLEKLRLPYWYRDKAYKDMRKWGVGMKLWYSGQPEPPDDRRVSLRRTYDTEQQAAQAAYDIGYQLMMWGWEILREHGPEYLVGKAVYGEITIDQPPPSMERYYQHGI